VVAQDRAWLVDWDEPRVRDAAIEVALLDKHALLFNRRGLDPAYFDRSADRAGCAWHIPRRGPGASTSPQLAPASVPTPKCASGNDVCEIASCAMRPVFTGSPHARSLGPGRWRAAAGPPLMV
jgi:hypothetical protein